MKNVICIDLTKFNNEKLAEVANQFGLNVDALIREKKEGIAKIYVLDSVVIAYTTKKDSEINYTTGMDKLLSEIKPIEAKKKEPKIMTVDTILDKISKYGIESLNVNEKKFLDENSK